MKVQLFIPCFIDQLYPSVGFNMVKILEKLGCTISYNGNQTCCGQPAFNAGFLKEAKAVCSKFFNDFKGADYIVAPSASCVGFIRNYAQNLYNDNASVDVKTFSSRCFELTEFIVDILGVNTTDAVFEGVATYHDSCAALRECNIKTAPRILLNNVKGLSLIEMKDTENCCGFGGSFAVKYEAISVAMGDQKIQNALDTSAEYIISTDMSCLMHLGACIDYQQKPLKVLHIADVLASGW